MDHVEYTQQEYSVATPRWGDRNQQKKELHVKQLITLQQYNIVKICIFFNKIICLLKKRKLVTPPGGGCRY